MVTTDLKVCICRDINGGQGVACSCGGLLTHWGNRWGCSKLLFVHTLTDPLLQRNIIHRLSSLSALQFCEKGSTRADYSQFVLRPAPTLDYTHFSHYYIYMNVVENGMAIYLYFRAITSNTSLIIISHESKEFLSYCSSIPWCLKIFNNFNRIKRLQWNQQVLFTTIA